jgi:phosphoribosylamine--glycine ligase
MRILVIDPLASALDWIMRCQDAGHKVKWWVKPSPKSKDVGVGIAERVADPREWAKWADLIFMADNTMYVEGMDTWRKAGWPVVGACPLTCEWELDRGIGQAVLKRAGVKTSDYKVFKDYDPAIAYVKREMKRFVSKPSGDADKALSYVSKSPADMVYMLERWKKAQTLKGDFIIQDFIPGIEMAVGGWFGPGGFNEGFCENWEFKKLMNDDLGVATGEQGTVVRYVKKSKLADKVLRPCEDQLEDMSYIGYVDVNCIIAEDGTPYPLEFTMRPGWPTFNIQQALNEGDPAQWLMDLASGKDARNFTMDAVAVGVVLAIPDYPYSKITRKDVTGIPIYGMTKQNRRWLHPCELMAGTAPVEMDGKILNALCLVSAGDYLLVASGIGDTISAAKGRAYRTIKQLEVPNSPMYRTDIGNRLRKQLPELQKMGYATDLTF